MSRGEVIDAWPRSVSGRVTGEKDGRSERVSLAPLASTVTLLVTCPCLWGIRTGHRREQWPFQQQPVVPTAVPCQLSLSFGELRSPGECSRGCHRRESGTCGTLLADMRANFLSRERVRVVVDIAVTAQRRRHKTRRGKEADSRAARCNANDTFYDATRVVCVRRGGDAYTPRNREGLTHRNGRKEETGGQEWGEGIRDVSRNDSREG